MGLVVANAMAKALTKQVAAKSQKPKTPTPYQYGEAGAAKTQQTVPVPKGIEKPGGTTLSPGIKPSTQAAAAIGAMQQYLAKNPGDKIRASVVGPKGGYYQARLAPKLGSFGKGKAISPRFVTGTSA